MQIPAQGYKITKNQENMTPLKEYSKPLVTGPKEMEIQKLPDKNKQLMISGKQYKNKMRSLIKRQKTLKRTKQILQVKN